MQMISMSSNRHYRLACFFVVLVVGLRVWGDFDRPYFSHVLPMMEQLWHNVPADDLRFVFNFPASLLSSFLLPPPVRNPPMTLAVFVLRESSSVVLEVVLTFIWWLAIGRLLRSRLSSYFTKIPFRAALPMYFLVWTVYFSYLGGLQGERLSGSGTIDAATHLFSGFSVNAPAWVTSEFIYEQLSAEGWRSEVLDYCYHCTFSFQELRGAPWDYFAAVTLMWFLIGDRLDHWRQGNNDLERYTLTLWGRLIWSVCAVLGVFLLYRSVVALWAFKLWVVDFWLPVSAMIWSAVWAGGSLYVLVRDGKGRWGAGLRVIPLVLGIAAVGFANFLISRPDYQNTWIPGTAYHTDEFSRTLSIAAWGLALFLEGCYFLWHWKDRPAPPQNLAP